MERQQIAAEMQRVRSERVERVTELRAEAERLQDWREHVRAAPIAFVAAAVGMGFWWARRREGDVRNTVSSVAGADAPVASPRRNALAGITRAAAGSLGPLAGSLLKAYLLSQLNGSSRTTPPSEERQP